MTRHTKTRAEQVIEFLRKHGSATPREIEMATGIQTKNLPTCIEMALLAGAIDKQVDPVKQHAGRACVRYALGLGADKFAPAGKPRDLTAHGKTTSELLTLPRALGMAAQLGINPEPPPAAKPAAPPKVTTTKKATAPDRLKLSIDQDGRLRIGEAANEIVFDPDAVLAIGDFLHATTGIWRP